MTTATTAAPTVRDQVLEDLFRATVTLCRSGSSLSRHDPVLAQVITDLDHAIRLLRDSTRLDALALVR